jgi:prepilin-type N-terminal cleavage/methylation domain-containing protein
LNFKRIRNSRRGFSLVELMIALVVSSVLVGSIVFIVNKTRRTGKVQRLRANIESLAQISFFIMGRDIRRAGSNPLGALGGSTAAPLPLA